MSFHKRSTTATIGIVFGTALLLGGCGEPEYETTGKKLVPSPKELDLPNVKPAPDKYRVKLKTSEGDVVIEVTRDWAPRGADRFYLLVKHGFYDECRFFRVIENFVAQAGINGDPRVMADWNGATIEDDPVKESNIRGYVTFAQGSSPNTRSTQFFINYQNASDLDKKGFAPFGRVIKGMGVVDSFFSGYGEHGQGGNGPSQEMIQKHGNAYLKEKFPQLDYIIKATILEDGDSSEKTSDGDKTKTEKSAKSPEKTPDTKTAEKTTAKTKTP